SPGIITRLAGSRNREEPPRQPPSPGIKRGDIASMSAVTPCASDNDFVFYQDGRAGYIASALLDFLDFDVPRLPAGSGIQRDHVIVHCPEKYKAISNRKPAVEFAIGDCQIARDLVVVGP